MAHPRLLGVQEKRDRSIGRFRLGQQHFRGKTVSRCPIRATCLFLCRRTICLTVAPVTWTMTTGTEMEVRMTVGPEVTRRATAMIGCVWSVSSRRLEGCITGICGLPERRIRLIRWKCRGQRKVQRVVRGRDERRKALCRCGGRAGAALASPTPALEVPAGRLQRGGKVARGSGSRQRLSVRSCVDRRRHQTLHDDSCGLLPKGHRTTWDRMPIGAGTRGPSGSRPDRPRTAHDGPGRSSGLRYTSAWPDLAGPVWPGSVQAGAGN